MRLLKAIGMVTGLTLMTMPVVLPRLGGVEGVMEVAGFGQQRSAKFVSADDDGGGMLAGTWSAVAGAIGALAGGATGGQMVSATGANGAMLPARDMSAPLDAACKLMALRTGSSAADCMAQLGPLSQPGGMQGLMDEVTRAVNETNTATGFAPVATAPVAPAPRLMAPGDTRASAKGGAKFVRVEN